MRKVPRTAWKKGQSGNPKGREKTGKTIAEQTRSLLDSHGINLTITNSDGQKQVIDIKTSGTIGQAIMARMATDALKGDAQAAKEVLARGYGKVPDKLEMTGDALPKLTLEIVESRKDDPPSIPGPK